VRGRQACGMLACLGSLRPHIDDFTLLALKHRWNRARNIGGSQDAAQEGCCAAAWPRAFILCVELGLPCGRFWAGIRGDLTAEQLEALKSAGIVAYDLRRTAGGWGEASD
jgi:hypothetical protein